jgi:hypothetical protein
MNHTSIQVNIIRLVERSVLSSVVAQPQPKSLRTGQRLFCGKCLSKLFLHDRFFRFFQHLATSIPCSVFEFPRQATSNQRWCELGANGFFYAVRTSQTHNTLHNTQPHTQTNIHPHPSIPPPPSTAGSQQVNPNETKQGHKPRGGEIQLLVTRGVPQQ